jgi:hypothetical protein
MNTLRGELIQPQNLPEDFVNHAPPLDKNDFEHRTGLTRFRLHDNADTLDFKFVKPVQLIFQRFGKNPAAFDGVQGFTQTLPGFGRLALDEQKHLCFEDEPFSSRTFNG